MPRQAEPSITERSRAGVVATPASSRDAHVVEPAEVEADVVLDDLLVEDVSIDGMCGVY